MRYAIYLKQPFHKRVSHEKHFQKIPDNSGSFHSQCLRLQSVSDKDEAVNAARAEVLNQYQRRADLIPNLVQYSQGIYST